MSSIEYTPLRRASTLQRARYSRIYAIASIKLARESSGYERRLDRLLGHVAVLENIEQQQQRDELCTKAYTVRADPLPMPPLGDLEQTPSVIVTESNDDEDDENDRSASTDDDDDLQSLTSDSSSDEEDDCFPDLDMENDAEHMLVRLTSHDPGDFCRGLENHVASLCIADKGYACGIAKFLDENDKLPRHNNSGMRSSEVVVVEIA